MALPMPTKDPMPTEDEIRRLAIVARAASENWKLEHPADPKSFDGDYAAAADERSLSARGAAVQAVIALLPIAPDLVAKAKQIDEALDAAARPAIFVTHSDQDPPLDLGEIAPPKRSPSLIALQKIFDSLAQASHIERVRTLRAALILVGDE